MATSGFTNFIDCAALKIYALPEAEISVTNGIISKTLGIDDVFEIEAGWKIYVVYIQQKDFGTWTVVSTIGNTDRQKSVVINNFSLYTIDFVLPNDYQRLDYITFPSGAYINTGLYANAATDGIFTEIKVSETSYVNDKHYFGLASGINYHVTSYNSGSGATNQYWHSINKNGTVTDVHHGLWTAGEKIIKYNDLSNGTTLVVNNQILDAGYPAPVLEQAILIGSRSGTSNFVGNVYYCLMKNNTTLQYERKLYPARRVSDSVLGMYDVITDTFYTNAGSGTFTAGSIIDTKYSPLYLYNHGNENISITGGWDGSGWLNENNAACDLATNTGTALRCAPTSGKQSIAATINKIDLTNYSYIVYKGTRIKAESNGVCVQWSGVSSTKKAGSNMEKYFNVNNTGILDYSLDVSSLIGSYYVVFCTGNSNNCIAEATEIYLI